MDKLRIQVRDGNGKHVKTLTVLSKDVEATLSKLFLLEERKTWEVQKTKELADLIHNKKIREFINSDLFDREAVGSDISCEEFLENELWFEVRGL